VAQPTLVDSDPRVAVVTASLCPCRESLRLLVVATGGEDRELVAPLAGERVLRAHGRREGAGNLDQRTIPDQVSQRVVDLLEPIEVKHHHCERLT
jgi:hypothetical protein